MVSMTENAQHPTSPVSSNDYRMCDQERYIRELRERQEEELAEEKAILYYMRHETCKHLW